MSKPCYSAIRQHAGARQPAIVFVPTRKHARTTSLDLLTYAAADGEPYKFRLVAEADLEVYLARVKDPALAHGLRYGVGYMHETQPEAERQVVELLFNAGAIQVGWVGVQMGVFRCLGWVFRCGSSDGGIQVGWVGV